MKLDDYITIEDFCNSHRISSQFVMELYDLGLVEVVRIREISYLPLAQLPKAEKIVRLYLDLEINLEGIEVVTHLLDRIQSMHGELVSLRNKLSRYE